jgi:hypothetical protein
VLRLWLGLTGPWARCAQLLLPGWRTARARALLLVVLLVWLKMPKARQINRTRGHHAVRLLLLVRVVLVRVRMVLMVLVHLRREGAVQKQR